MPLAHALQVIEGQGRAYPVEEVSQIKRIAEKYQKTANRPEKIRTVSLTKRPATASEDRIRQVDIGYTLPFDLKDSDGKVLLPKGYTYNPLAKRTMTSLIIIDGENQQQIEWARLKKDRLKPAKVLLSNGSSMHVMQTRKLRCYHLNDQIMERFQIEKVPCTVVQKEQHLEIQEFGRLAHSAGAMEREKAACSK